MKFDESKKIAIISYLLEKIAQDCPSISKKVSEEFDINQNTVHKYIDELLDKKAIERVKRGKYKLVSIHSEYNLTRSKGELEDEMTVYNLCLKEKVSKLSANVQRIWEYSFSEMMNNAIDHSEAENVCVSIDENYAYMTVTIKDDGVGIFEKIKNHFDFDSLEAAVCELFKGKLTTDSSRHSGEGIFFTSKMMDEFYIFSDGKIFSSNKYDNSDLHKNDDFSSGTSVVMRLSNFTNRNVSEVFDRYSNVDDGFTKTIIPVKNIFDSSPVSRSQAKRICYRLEKFKEIVFDFDGVNWMGQGFAHQVFCLFQSEYPNIKLIPINMNESVEKMYHHVVKGSLES